MNETEAKARRLLAAATEDMPPGVDLLAGFGAARREKAGRTRRRAAVSAGLMAAAASATAVALTVGSTPPAFAKVSTITTALTRTLAQSYHVSEQRSITVNGAYSHETCTAQVDPVRKLDASSCSGPPPGYLEVGGYSYLYLANIAGHPGKHWQRWRQPFLPQPLIDTGTVRVITLTPQQVLSQLKRLTKVSVTGPVSGPGWTGTRYAFAYGSTRLRFSGTVDVDQQGRARALTLTSRCTGFHTPAATPQGIPGYIPPFAETQSLTFSDFGAPVIVTPPPADQTITVPA
ncbi:MAG: hypothetical protein M3Z75_28535 [Actinomycetota bacterium]|nr:hypothetical protein [Actinomycetota bacterium]